MLGKARERGSSSGGGSSAATPARWQGEIAPCPPNEAFFSPLRSGVRGRPSWRTLPLSFHAPGKPWRLVLDCGSNTHTHDVVRCSYQCCWYNEVGWSGGGQSFHHRHQSAAAAADETLCSGHGYYRLKTHKAPLEPVAILSTRKGGS